MITYNDILNYFKQQNNKEAVIMSRGLSGNGFWRPTLSFRSARVNLYTNGKAAEVTEQDIGITVGIDQTVQEHLFPVIKLSAWWGSNGRDHIDLRGTVASWIETLSTFPKSMLNHEVMVLDQSYMNVAVNLNYGGCRIGPIDATNFVYRCVNKEKQDYEVYYDPRRSHGEDWAREYIDCHIIPEARDQYHVSKIGREINSADFIIFDCMKRNNVRYYLSFCDGEGFTVA